MVKNLIDWAADQSPWIRDCLRRIAVATDHLISEEDLAAIIENVRSISASAGAPRQFIPIDELHIGVGAGDKRRTILAQIGPVQGIDRLASGQRLRMAPEGITLIYGENGSGKSGYTRIAKKLCRSLSVDELRGNAFAPAASDPMRVEVRYRIGADEVSTFEWDPATRPPSVLHQISVFDSHNARLYVSGENKIAYLPRELAILEHHGALCQSMSAIFRSEGAALAARVKVPLPAGYTAGTEVSAVLGSLNSKNSMLPTDDDLRRLAELSAEDVTELAILERELASDPVTLAATRRRAVALLTRVLEVLAKLTSDLSDAVGASLYQARRELNDASSAERLAATTRFADEPLADVGGTAWRVLFEAARAFAISQSDTPPERIPDAIGNLCLLCQEPLSPSGSARLKRFNDFVEGEISRRANRARDALRVIEAKLIQVSIPETAVVEESLLYYGQLDPNRAEIVTHIGKALAEFGLRRAELLDVTASPSPMPDNGELVATISRELKLLEEEAASLQQSAIHSSLLDEKRRRLAELKDRMKLGHDIDTVMQRRRDVAEQIIIAKCLDQVATRPVSNQITALRKQLITDELERRVVEEINEFDLSHLPFKISEYSGGGQSLFSIGLKGAGKIKNNQILSEGEQRALALACFLAEIGGDDARYGIIVDDPVSSLDHLRMRKVAKRLIVEAKKGRQVIIFTHNMVFFNEMVSEAARASVPMTKSVISKTHSEGFGVVAENSVPWIADINARIASLRERTRALGLTSDFDTDDYRRMVKDFYSDLRESWERLVEEVVLAKTIERFVPDVMTGRLKEVSVTDEDYKIIFFAMKRASERSGHDMSAGRSIPPAKPEEMVADLKALDDFRIAYRARRKATSIAREALETPQQANLV